jgi:hypothetical protein
MQEQKGGVPTKDWQLNALVFRRFQVPVSLEWQGLSGLTCARPSQARSKLYMVTFLTRAGREGHQFDPCIARRMEGQTAESSHQIVTKFPPA